MIMIIDEIMKSIHQYLIETIQLIDWCNKTNNSTLLMIYLLVW